MRIDSIASAGAPARSIGSAAGTVGKGFVEALRESMSSLAALQSKADVASQQVATGDLAHLHAAVIAVQEASLAVELAVAVRNHVVEGVQELLRTQA
jgi:flagellar hook-basal body complex protein FliE